jgi:hypothetical protein
MLLELNPLCMQEERYVHSFSQAVSAATNTAARTQNALTVIGRFDSVPSLCKLLQDHFQKLEECAPAVILCLLASCRLCLTGHVSWREKWHASSEFNRAV